VLGRARTALDNFPVSGSWGHLSCRGWLWLLAAAAAAAALWVLGTRYAAQPGYAPVASGLPPAAIATDTALLDRYGIRWELENAGQTLAVDSARSAQARRLLAGRLARAGAPQLPAALDPAAASVKNSLDGMLRTVLGPGKAYVTVNATLARNRSSSTSLVYSKTGAPLAAQRSSSSAGGYSASGSNVAWGRTVTQTSVTYAPGAVQKLRVALLVDASVPKATVAKVKAAVAAAAGLVRARGDTLSVAQVRFPPAAASRTTATSLSSLLRPAVAYGPFALLGLGLLGAAATTIKRREETAL